MATTRAPDGWYFRRDGWPVGPVSTEQLRKLLASGEVQPRQAVWRGGPRRLFFVAAATAAADPVDGDPQAFTPGLSAAWLY